MGRRKMAAGIAAFAVAMAAAGMFLTVRGKTKVEKTAACREHVEDFYTEEGVLNGGKRYQIIAEVSGTVKETATEENAKVKKGDLLLVIDSSDYERQKYMAECAMAGYEAQLEESRISRVMMSSPREYLDEIEQEVTLRETEYETARTVYEGSQVLYQSGDISKVELEQRKAEYQKSRLAVEQARSRYEESSRMFSRLGENGISQSQINDRFYESEEKQLTMLMEAERTKAEQLEEKIEKCRITAPEDGIIRELPSKELSVIQAGQTVVSMTAAGQVTAEADVLTNIAPYLKTGEPVEITVKLRGQTVSCQGHIRQVYDFAKQGTSSLGLDEYRVHVVAELDEGQEENFSGFDGYGVKLKFCLFDEEGCITVPSGAVYEEDGEHYVFKIMGDRAVRQKVEIGYRSGFRAVVREGLDEGEIIIGQADSEGVYDGAKVR